MRSVYNAFKVPLTPQYNVVLSGVKVGKAWKANQVCVKKIIPAGWAGKKLFGIFFGFCRFLQKGGYFFAVFVFAFFS